MPARIYRIFISLCLVLFIASGIYAENINDTPEVISLYTKGKRFLRESEWLAAAGVFKELEGRFSQSKNIDLFIFHRAKAEFYLGDYNEAIAGFNYFISRFQNSAVISYAYFFLGNSLYLNGNVNQAVKSYLKAYLLSGEKELNQLVASSLVEAFKNASSIHLNESDFELLSDEKKCIIIKPLAEILIKKGAIEQANSLLSICGEKIDPLNNQATNYRRLKKQLEIALVIPLEGELHSFGEEIYNGATIAADFYREKTGHNIKLMPYDTKGEPIEAARIIRELSRSTTTDVIVGPLTSEEAAVSSAILSCASIPMITPAATQSGLTRLSETSFQLSPNIELEGITLAEYAFNQLLADTAAIISSTATEHLRMTGAFSEHFKKLGGVIIATEYYRSRDKDFGVYIRDIKSILLGHPADSTFFITEEGDTIDFDIAPTFVDCLFIPGNPKQLRQLLPQI
ncbi:MAG: penicillin-binding protein activator, partial [Candidatus Zixiibacteriota bacterium]